MQTESLERTNNRDKYPPVILASSSPRRYEILSRMGLSFTVDSADVDESVDRNLKPHEAVKTLALRKAAAVAPHYTQGLIIGADTVVVVDNVILGKPSNHEDALAMLLTLQGREHSVYSGYAVIDAASGKTEVDYDHTAVVFRSFTEEEARRYIATGEPLGKAGAYAIQGLGALFVKEIHGDYLNVVGLPLFKLAQTLKNFGLDILNAALSNFL